MTCNKCNHKLPDDSEFCQYCGNKVEKVAVVPTETAADEPKKIETPVVVPAASTMPISPVVDTPNIDDMAPNEALNSILKTQAKNTIVALEANRKTQPDNEDDADFGLVPEKPIYTLALQLVDGEEEYLNQLYTVNGEKIKYNRLGSTGVDGINGMIDIYETYLPSGQPYKTLFINMYGAKRSTKAPAGFVLGTPTTQNHPAPKENNPVKIKYCSRCGSVIDSKTKTCTGCGKQYFRGFKFTKFSVTVTVLALIIATISTLCILQYINTQKMEDKISDLTQESNIKQYTIDHLRNKIDDLENKDWETTKKLFFFDAHAEIIGDDNTKIYHKYGCTKLDTSDGFWILNSEAAESRGYTKCSRCH